MMYSATARIELGPRARPELVELICDNLMKILLDFEDETGGDIHSGAVSATIATAQIDMEFCVDAGTAMQGHALANSWMRRIQERLQAVAAETVHERQVVTELLPA